MGGSILDPEDLVKPKAEAPKTEQPKAVEAPKTEEKKLITEEMPAK
jgi:hypothetical protein